MKKKKTSEERGWSRLDAAAYIRDMIREIPILSLLFWRFIACE